MKTTTLVGVVAAAALLAPAVFAQPGEPRDRRMDLNGMLLVGRGAEIGVRVVDRPDGGVVIEEVRPETPAEKAGLKKSDVLMEFDGERVRSARQFGRLVSETPPGRTVKATITREGQRRDVQITPREGRPPFRDGVALDQLRDELGRFRPDRMLPPGAFNFDLDLPGIGRRLGVGVMPLGDQLAQHFGVPGGVLVADVTTDSPASRAGLRAGDVIVSIDGKSVRTREDLVRALREATADDVSIAIVRDRKEMTLKATIERPARRTVRSGRPA
jgi:serine protease Do